MYEKCECGADCDLIDSGECDGKTEPRDRNIDTGELLHLCAYHFTKWNAPDSDT